MLAITLIAHACFDRCRKKPVSRRCLMGLVLVHVLLVLLPLVASVFLILSGSGGITLAPSRLRSLQLYQGLDVGFSALLSLTLFCRRPKALDAEEKDKEAHEKYLV